MRGTGPEQHTAAVRSSGGLFLCILGAMPLGTDAIAPGSPPWRKISNAPQGRIESERLFHRDDTTVFDCVSSAADERPIVVIGVVCDAKNGQMTFQNLPRRDRRDVWTLVKWPVGCRHNE